MTQKPRKHGCPNCGKPTSGMPTPKGFVWSLCDDCLQQTKDAQKSKPSHSDKRDRPRRNK